MRRRHFIDHRLDTIRPFSGFPRPELEAITSLSLPVSVEPAKVLTQQGQFGDQLLIVLTGAGATAIGGATYGTVGPGDVLGSVAVLGNKPHLSTVTATEPMDLLAVAISDVTRLFFESPSLIRALAQNMARRLFDSEHALRNDALRVPTRTAGRAASCATVAAHPAVGEGGTCTDSERFELVMAATSPNS